MTNALEIESLTKTYGDGFQALKGIDLHVAEGDFFALLGPNGAGKSTTLGIVCSLVNKTAGKVRVFGYDTDTHLSDAKLNLGVVPQEFNFNQFEKVFDIVTTQAGYYGIPFKQASASAEKYLKKLGLWDKRNTPARMLSGGMKRRVLLARALLRKPDLLVLDEPAQGVDVSGQDALYGLLGQVRDETGCGILLISHDLHLVMARTDQNNKGAGGITAFIVEGDTPGLIRGKPDVKMGQKGAHVCDITFEDCRVPAENIIGGKEGQGFKTAMKVLDRGRLHISAVCVGVAERLIEDALRFAMERKQFGAPLADHQLIQAMLADSRAEAFAGRSMVLEAARSKDAGKNVSLDASCCKLFCAEMVGRVADRAVQIHGGAGYMAEYAIERLYRDARLLRIYEGTSQIQQIIIARNIVKAAKDRM